jgi:stage V sporulation protein S
VDATTIVEDHSALSDEDDDDRWNLKDPGRIAPATPPPGFRAKTPPPEKVEVSNDGVMRVSGSSPSQAVAFSIQRVIFNEVRMPVIRAIGAGAVNQACKGIAIARGMVAVRGLDLICAIGFDNITNDQGEEISSMVFRLSVK